MAQDKHCHKIALVAALCGLCGSADAALLRYLCALENDGLALPVEFTLDPTQFAAPISAGEPPRRQIATGLIGPNPFRGEAFITESRARGFWVPGRDVLLVMERDGTAKLTLGDTRYEGTCALTE